MFIWLRRPDNTEGDADGSRDEDEGAVNLDTITGLRYLMRSCFSSDEIGGNVDGLVEFPRKGT